MKVSPTDHEKKTGECESEGNYVVPVETSSAETKTTSDKVQRLQTKDPPSFVRRLPCGSHIPKTREGRIACAFTCVTLTTGFVISLIVLIVGVIGGNMLTVIPSTSGCVCNRNQGWNTAVTPARFETNTNCSKYKYVDMSIYHNSSDLVEEIVLTPRGGSETLRIAAYVYRERGGAVQRNQNGETVILTPGYGASRTKYTLMIPASMLAEMGFNVVSIDTRGHGDSDARLGGRTSWGCTEFKDTLGAWDWAVEHLAGGDTSRVGVQGASLGGHISQITFAVERRIPAVFLDSPVFTVRRVANQRLDGMGLSSDLFRESMLHFAEEYAECEIRNMQPHVLLPGSNASYYDSNVKRKIGITSGLEDTSVPWTYHGEVFVDFARNEGYNVTRVWAESTLDEGESCDGCYDYPFVRDGAEDCGDGRFEAEHVRQMLRWPGTYRKLLCYYWSDVFDRDPALCGLDRWPDEAMSSEYAF